MNKSHSCQFMIMKHTSFLKEVKSLTFKQMGNYFRVKHPQKWWHVYSVQWVTVPETPVLAETFITMHGAETY